MGLGDTLSTAFGLQGGLGFQPQAAPIVQATNPQQVTGSYWNAQGGLNAQQQYLQNLLSQPSSNQQNVFNQQQGLANQLQGVANGTGPNPALQQLQNTTGQNVQNQAAMMASQRGVGANAGLLARQAAMQGANIQQQAVGQGAALSAQQQLAGMGLLQGQQANMAGLANAQTANTQNALMGYSQAAQSEQQNLLNALAQNNQSNVTMQSNINNANALIANTAAQGQQGLIGGLASGLGAAAMKGFGGGAPAGGVNPTGTTPQNQQSQGTVQELPGGGGTITGGDVNMARGGMVQRYADGGAVDGPMSNAGRFLYSSAPAQTQPLQDVPFYMPAGNGSTVLRSAGDNTGQAVAQGLGTAFQAYNAYNEAKGGKVPGKAQVKGDSLKNDNVPAMLSAGEIVIPRHITQSADPVNNSAKFVAAVLARGSMRRGK